MTLLMLALALAQNPVVMVREPLPPSQWVLTTGADCGKASLRFSDFGVGLNAGATPRVTLRGRPLAGPSVAQLIADLSTVRAIYRFSIQCERDGDILVRIYSGEAQRDGPVQYRAALARIKRRKLDYYSGLEPANAETFWYR
jgi:hypothetical protein